MDAQAAPPLRDVDQRIHEVGEFCSQRREFVDDEDHPRQGRTMLAGGILGDVSGADDAQLLLAVAQLGLQARERPRAELLVQVGDQADHMWKPAACIEG